MNTCATVEQIIDLKAKLDLVQKQAMDYQRWWEGLTLLDRRNFLTLLDLPNPVKVIERCLDEEYKRMARFALQVRRDTR